VCFAVGGDVLVTAVDAKPKKDLSRPLRRVRNIGENPRVALVVDEYDEDWSRLRWVMVEGRATILRGGAEHAAALEVLMAKYVQYRSMRLAETAGAVITIAPDRILHWRWT
jgi:PPOX class probable F420-dependent enzyme